MEKIKTTLQHASPIARVLIVCGVIGLFASVSLTVEEIKLLKNPEASLACDINPVVTCGETILTDQASILGVPNTLIGIVTFSAVLTIGVSVLAGATFARWFWQGLQLGVTAGFLFTLWLIYNALYVIGSLCIYCMTTWAIMIPLFVLLSRYTVKEKLVRVPKPVETALHKYTGSILLAIYGLIISLILIRFWDYWSTLI